jgi:hypothetical protein
VVLRDAALDARHHLVADAGVGEGAAHHDFMVAAARAVAVEVALADLPLQQVFAGRRNLVRIAPAGENVVGGEAVRQHRPGPARRAPR